MSKPAFPNPAATLPGEADILANVLADLSDHDAKLVYADWLEEHNDKRGPLLREFITAYRAEKKLPALKPVPKAWRDLIGITLMGSLRAMELFAKTDQILSLARPTIGFTTTKAAEKAIPVGASKLGGGPDMPPGAKWPTYEEEPLAFLGQFDLAELHTSPVARDLPAAGLFSVFARYDEDDGNDDFPKGSWRLLYFPETRKLTRSLPPEPSFRSCRVEYTESLTLPDQLASPWKKDLTRILRRDEVAENCYLDIQMEMCPGDHLLGHPLPIQGDVLGKKSVRHLLTICENDDTGWEWGDGGVLFFTINETDLQKQRFDRVKMQMDCA